MKSCNEIRSEFIDFFKKKGHTQVLAAPVIPFDDPTLLFTNAGMNQFKDVFLGQGKREYSRAVNTQKCIRAGGKHNDLDEVGKDSYHHSFFEMLGNWSFGDFYKKEAIVWAWELLTEVWKLPKEKLHATVYTNDDEAENIWKTETDIDHSHITRHGDKDNFWSMGETGPCGPCSEIHFDRGEEFCNKKNIPGHICAVNGDCDRIIEIWNLVFIQYNRDNKGVLKNLPNRHVDTGMGFERVCMLLQNVDSNYHIDIFKDIISEIETLSNVKYHADERGIPHRVIADHIRALLFSISDGGMPSNEGRGYVLRRILRRASRYGSKLNMNEPFLYKLVPVVSRIMGDSFPEIREYEVHAQNIIQSEEKSFLKTLKKGIDLFNNFAKELANDNKTILNGETVFKLYDTFGFPVDLTEQMAEEIGFTIDKVKFAEEMAKQKDKSRKSQKFKADTTIDWVEINNDIATEFIGYDNTIGDSKIIKYYFDEDTLQIVPDKSFFYAEMGGQVGDKGKIIISDETFEVFDVIKDGEYFILKANKKGKNLPPISKDTILKQFIDDTRRNGCRKHHTSTHLLHKAMKIVIGDHVAQSGSFVDEKLLRFDFSHFNKLTEDQLHNIEVIVNEEICKNTLVKTEVTSLDEAKKRNVTALFGEKYGDKVRIVSVDSFSSELCGGTHVKQTGDIGYFKIIEEGSLAAGIRRITAYCGKSAVLTAFKQQKITESLKSILICKENDITERTSKLITDKKSLEKELNQLKGKLAEFETLKLVDNAKIIDGISIIAKVIKVDDNKTLKNMAEHLRTKFEKGIILLGADFGNKCGLVCAVSDAIKKDYPAGKIVGAAAKIVGGGGGGATHIATAGGKDSSKLSEAIQVVESFITNI